MLLMMVAGALAGMLTGLRFRVFALLPLLACGILAIVGLASMADLGWASMIGRIAAFSIGAQVGYVVMAVRTADAKVAPRLMASH